jgi:hypothetical protein
MKNFGGESMSETLGKLFRTSLVVGLIAVQFIAPRALAAPVEDLSILLSDSRASTATNVTITYDQAAGGDFSAGDTIIVTFPTAMDTSGFASTDALDYDITVNGIEETVVDSGDACTTDVIEITTVASDVFTFTACSGYLGEAADTVIVIEIGTHATAGGTGNTQATNSTAGTYTFTVDSTDEDAKDALVAVTSGVTLSATIDETLTFTVAGVTTGNCSVAGGTEIDTSGSATTIPFGTINSDAFYDACQNLTVGTNAAGGYSTTVKTTTLPTSGGNTIAEGTCDGTCSDTTAAAWATATNNGYGYCLKDEVGDGAVTSGWSGTNECGDGTQFFKTINRVNASEAGQSIMASAGATTSNDQTEIGYRITIDAGQAAGSYSTVIIYVTTPTF